MKKTLVALMLAMLPLAAPAQTNPEFADLNDTIEMVRSVAALERRNVLRANLGLTMEESAEFWPIYDEYDIDKKRINDRLVKIITDYAAEQENLSDKLAKSMVDDWFKVQNDLLKLKKSYLRKFRRVLEPKTVMRFYQIDNKLDVIANVRLAQGIPLVEN